MSYPFLKIDEMNVNTDLVHLMHLLTTPKYYICRKTKHSNRVYCRESYLEFHEIVVKEDPNDGKLVLESRPGTRIKPYKLELSLDFKDEEKVALGALICELETVDEYAEMEQYATCEEFCDRLRELIEESADDEKQIRFLRACISGCLKWRFLTFN